MSHLSDLRHYRKIAAQAVTQYPLRNVRIDYIGFSENVVYKITAHEGEFLLRIHGSSFRTEQAIIEELNFLTFLSDQGGFELQKPLKAINQDVVVKLDGHIISLLSWQVGQKKHKSINERHIGILGEYMAQLHQFADDHRADIKMQHRDYWSPDNLIGDKPILGAFDQLETIQHFNREIFEACRLKTLANLKQHSNHNPQLLGVIHADLHFSNILWHRDALLPIDFDDCGMGSFLHDLSIPIINMHIDRSEKLREILLNAYCQTRNLSQTDLNVIDDYIMARHIAMHGWIYSRSNNPKFKAYHASDMQNAMNILKARL